MEREEIMEGIFDIMKEILQDDDKLDKRFFCDKTLKDIGINSIQFISFVAKVETKFNVEFDDDFLNIDRFSNIVDILDYVEKKID